jgi:hypothetical protein
MLKVDLHTHTGEDPQDRIGYSARALVNRAAVLGFDALAVTNHNALTFDQPLREYAREKRVLLLPGTEITVDGRHVLVINPRFTVSPKIRFKLADIPRLKTPDSLFIAPHPYFAIFQSLGSKLQPLLPYFDAVEFASYHNRLVNFNRRGVREALEAGKPLVATSDCHTLRQFGKTYSLIEAEPTLEGIIAAVKAGRVEIRTAPISLWTMAQVVFKLFSFRKLARLLER